MQTLPKPPVFQKVPTFIVPSWAKAAFSWLAIVLLFSLVGFQAHKRWLYHRLYAFNVMKPIVLDEQAVPTFSLQKGNDGGPILLSYFQKKWVLLHFWATWCPPCREEMPSLEILHRGLRDQLVVIAASVDENWDEVRRFFNNQVPQMILAWDKGQETSRAFGVSKYPESFLISPDGKLVARFLGQRDWSSSEAKQYLIEAMTKQSF